MSAEAKARADRRVWLLRLLLRLCEYIAALAMFSFLYLVAYLLLLFSLTEGAK